MFSVYNIKFLKSGEVLKCQMNMAYIHTASK